MLCLEDTLMTRDAVLAALAEHISALALPHPTRIAVDGVDAAGKTTLADALVPLIEQCGRPVIRASVDNFQRPRVVRYARGSLSPDGYYEDAFDDAALRGALLDPLGPHGDRRYRTQMFDYRRNEPIDAPLQVAPANAVVLVDGVFLQRPELNGCWDLVVFLDVPFEVSLARALERDAALFGSTEVVHERYARRYIPAQQRYLAECRPREGADIVIENADPSRPVLVWSATTGGA
jgi:uridine kinase